jgi:transcriptional regulator with XRE-family HTH domain
MSVEDSQPDVGRRLATARLQRGLSQGIVARLAGIAPSYISRIENGRVHPTFRTVLRIASALKMPFEEIAGPGPARLRQRGGCPVTAGGRCLLDLVRAEAEIERGVPGEAFTPRQVRLLRRFASWLVTVGSDRQKAMEILLDELTRATTGDSPTVAGSRKSIAHS